MAIIPYYWYTFHIPDIFIFYFLKKLNLCNHTIILCVDGYSLFLAYCKKTNSFLHSFAKVDREIVVQKLIKYIHLLWKHKTDYRQDPVSGLTEGKTNFSFARHHSTQTGQSHFKCPNDRENFNQSSQPIQPWNTKP